MNEDDNKLKIEGLSPYSVIPESANIRPRTGIAYNLPEISVTPLNNPLTAPLTATDVKNKLTLISNINRALNTAGQIGAGALTTLSMFPGFITAPIVTSFGIAGGIFGSKAGEKLGNRIDQRFGTKNGALYGSILGGLAGGTIGATTPYAAGRLFKTLVKPSLIAREINKTIKNGTNSSERMYTTDGNGNYRLFNEFGEDIGVLNTTNPESGIATSGRGKGIAMVASKNKGHGVAEDLYNIAVLDALNLGYEGLESGHTLHKPKLTMHVTDKFPKIEWNLKSLKLINGKWELVDNTNQPPIRLLTGTTSKSKPSLILELTNHRINLEDVENLNIVYNELTGEFETIKPTVLEPKTSLRFFERPLSRISEAERAGVPKGERNLPELKRPFIDSNLKNWRESLSSKISKDIDKVDPIDVKKLGENDLSFANRKYSTKLYLLEKNNRESSVFSTKPVDDIKQYASLLEAVDPRFLNDNGLLSFYIRDYRLYLNDLGYKAGDLTDTEIAKLLTDQYNTLSSTLTGKLKGLVVFHSGPNFFDAFDYSMTGSNTGNMGYLGPGNYFSTEPSVYGSKGNFSTQGLIGKYRYPRRLPYLITNIKSTPVSRELRKAGIVPEYTSPPREVLTSDVAKLNYIQSYIKPLIDATKSRDMAILDDISVYPHKVYTKNNLIEFNVPRNTGIKSLFPHPLSFIKDANGKIIINRNWADPRINFKFGGKIIG